MARDPLDKVRKLLALARSAHVHEAAAAAAAAQAIVARYRLEGLLEADPGGGAAADPVGEEVLDTSKRSRRWRTALAAGLAEVNGCLIYTRQEGRLRHVVLVGAAADRAAVRSLWDWLVGRIEWLSATHGAGQDRRWHDDFRVGAAETVCARLREADAKEQGRLATAALVRVEGALAARATAARAHLDALPLRSGKSVRVGVAAWRAGREAGRDVPLDDDPGP